MKTYLVALDSSPVAQDVLRTALELATKTDARLVLVQAVSRPLELPPEAYAVSPDDVVHLLLEAALKDLAALQENLAKERVLAAVVRVGVPWQVVCEEAKARGAEPIIIGTHGHKFLDRLLGSTTQRVLTHAQQSVLAVWPTLHAAQRHTGSHRLSGQRIAGNVGPTSTRGCPWRRIIASGRETRADVAWG